MSRLRFPAALLVTATLAAGCGSDSSGNGGEPAPPPADTPRAEGDARTGNGKGGVKLTELGSFELPVFVAQPPEESEDLYVVEQSGTIRVIDDGRPRPEPFLDLSGEVSRGYEQGLLSMAFAPDYRRSGRLYVDYTDTQGDTRVVEYRRSAGDPLRADPRSAREILFVDQPEENHNGGLLLFGPDDQLYVGLGDGGGAGDPDRNGQDLGTLLGKILRIDPARAGEGRPYGLSDNPLAARPGARPEIYAYGLRNPWRFSFDRRTGALTIGDVGQDEIEELNYSPPGDAPGANYGWSAFEGDAPFNDDQSAPGHTPPVLTYGRAGGCSVTGGYVVRDRNLPSLYGRYLYADFCAGVLRSFVPAPGAARGDRELGLDVPQVSSFAEDNAGRIYATSLEGPVYRLDPAR